MKTGLNFFENLQRTNKIIRWLGTARTAFGFVCFASLIADIFWDYVLLDAVQAVAGVGWIIITIFHIDERIGLAEYRIDGYLRIMVGDEITHPNHHTEGTK